MVQVSLIKSHDETETGATLDDTGQLVTVTEEVTVTVDPGASPAATTPARTATITAEKRILTYLKSLVCVSLGLKSGGCGGKKCRELALMLIK
jgi:hypothetical protein